jgi:exopolysaccharide biosynthesis protein
LNLLFWFIMVDLLVVAIVGEAYFNLSSNICLAVVRDSTAPLEVHTRKGWRSMVEVTIAELGEALVERDTQDGLRWCSLPVRRRATTLLQSVVQTLMGAEMNIVTISPQRFHFVTSYLPGFAGSTARERLANDNLNFAITANFRDPAGRPLGWVYHEGQQVNRPFPIWTGVFFVKNGLPYFGPKSLLDDIPGDIQEGTQGYPSVMKNHTVFSYVDLAPDKFFDGKRITYRALAGTRRDGTVVFILSGDGAVCNVSEVTELAHKLEVQHATLLDGGRALQYSLRTTHGPWHFHAFNTEADIGPRWMRPQKSPVYIGVRRVP